jgi:serine protease Do
MFNKLFSSMLIVTSAFVLAAGQDSKKPNEDNAPRAFSFAFEGGSYLGVQTQEITKDNYAKFGLSGVRGVAVEKVSENSPATAAGIQAGDVILRFDGEDVTGVRKLTRLVGEVDPDHQVRLTISRNGREQEITATVAKRPMTEFQNGNFAFPQFNGTMPDMKGLERLKEMPQFKEMPRMPDLKNVPEGPQVWSFPGGQGQSFVWRAGEGRAIGVGVTGLSKQLAEHFHVAGGALVSEVRDGSPAAKAGLRAGDIITEVDGKQVKSEMDLIKSINEKKEGNVTVTFVRDGRTQNVTVAPEKSKDGGFMFNTGEKDNG